MLQLDLINAFNCCDRDSAFKVVEEAFPEILQWVLTCYGLEAELIFGHEPPRGLILSTAANCTRPKSTVWYPSATAVRPTNPDPLNRGIPLVQEDGIVLLGSPIGSKVFEKQAIEVRIDKVRELCSRLSLMEDAQSEYVLLRSCLSIPKIMFTLRTTDPLHHQDLWQNFDNLTRDSLSKILGVPVNNCQWSQAQLPVSKGGLGLRAAVDHAPAAYITSLLSSQDLKESILGKSGDQCPPAISTPLLNLLVSSEVFLRRKSVSR